MLWDLFRIRPRGGIDDTLFKWATGERAEGARRAAEWRDFGPRSQWFR